MDIIAAIEDLQQRMTKLEEVVQNSYFPAPRDKMERIDLGVMSLDSASRVSGFIQKHLRPCTVEIMLEQDLKISARHVSGLVRMTVTLPSRDD